MHNIKNFKITMLGIVPVLKDETGYLKPQDLVSLSALMTFKGKAVKDLYNEALEKGQDIEKKVETIIRKSSLRGHASMATTPAIAFTYEASKFIDSMMTGTVFSSSLMASGRRTDTVPEDIVIPSSINTEETKKIYLEESTKNIEALNKFLAEGSNKDDASKVLQYGIYGTGIIVYPIESIIAFKKEVESEGEWMPEEAKMFVEEIEKHLEELGVDLIYASRQLAPRDTYPIPNIFKNPESSNITRELVTEKGMAPELTSILDFHVLKTAGLENEAKKIVDLDQEYKANPEKVKNGGWRKLIEARRKLSRDYNLSVSLKTLSSVSWRVWGDKKRHRTVPMIPDSLYYSIERASQVFKKYETKITEKTLSKDELKELDRVFGIPGTFWENNEWLYLYLERVLESLRAYDLLVNQHQVKPSDAVFVIPRGIRIDVLQQHDLYNLISGYYPLRSCSTVESQLRPLTLREMSLIKDKLNKEGLTNIAKLIVTKCHLAHFCLEEKNCAVIKGLVKDYTEEFHEEIKGSLDEEFHKLSKEVKDAGKVTI